MIREYKKESILEPEKKSIKIFNCILLPKIEFRENDVPELLNCSHMESE